MEAALTNQGLLIIEKAARTYFGPKYFTMLNKLTVRTRQIVGPDKIAKVYSFTTINNVPVILIPRTIADTWVKCGTISTLRDLLPQGHKIGPFQPEHTLFPNQEAIVAKILAEYLKEPRGSCILNLPAGFGKTYVAASIIAAISLSTIYFVPSKELQRQVAENLGDCLPSAKIIQHKGTKNPFDVSADITIIVINTALKMPHDSFKIFGFSIFDEVHTYCSKERSAIFWRANTKYAMGMSATTENRLDGFDFVAKKHLGEVVRVDADLSNGFLGNVCAIYYEGPPEYTKTIISSATGKLFAPDMVKQFVEDPGRNRLIVDKMIDLWEDSERNIFVFSESREHLDVLRRMFLERMRIKSAKRMVRPAIPPVVQIFGRAIAKIIINKLAQEYLGDIDANPAVYVPELDNAALSTLRGGIKKKERELAEESRIILTTYGYSSTGISIDKMNAAIFATPRKNGFLQICPRIMRRGGDRKIPRIFVDIIDVNTGLARQFYERKKTYKNFGFDIVKITAS